MNYKPGMMVPKLQKTHLKALAKMGKARRCTADHIKVFRVISDGYLPSVEGCPSPFRFSTMVRPKIKYELIPNESSRKATFKKRRGGLLKKLYELTTLCGVMGFAIIYGTFNDQPEIWPPSRPELIHVLNKFKEMPRRKREKYSMNQKIFLSRNISKLKKWLDRERQKNQRREKELALTQLLAGESFQDICIEDLKELDHLLEEKIRSINDKLETIGKSNQVIAEGGNEYESQKMP